MARFLLVCIYDDEILDSRVCVTDSLSNEERDLQEALDEFIEDMSRNQYINEDFEFIVYTEYMQYECKKVTKWELKRL